jgi:hypothetical protein
MQHRSTRPAGGPARILMALAVLAAGIVIAPPAQAKVPSRAPQRTLKCQNGKKARFWWKATTTIDDRGEDGVFTRWDLTEFAVDNDCKGWLLIITVNEPLSESDCCVYLQVAPGANFTKKGTGDLEAALFEGFGHSAPFSVYEGSKQCADPDGDHHEFSYNLAKDGKISWTEDCVRKYPESQSQSQNCPDSFDPVQGRSTRSTRGVWKVDDKKILKLAVINKWCDSEPYFWWRTKDGRRIALWVDRHSSFDLWKAELEPLPVKTKDGAVYYNFPRSPTAADFDWFDEIWRVGPDGRPYRWHKST